MKPPVSKPLKKGKPLPLRQAIQRMHKRFGKALEKLAK